MATITRTHGNSFGVPHVDRALSTSGAITADEAVILDGPQLDFFKILVDDGSPIDLRNELDVGESVEAILRAVQVKSTIAMYQVEGDTTGQISVAVYPKGAWTAAALQTAIRALGSTVGSNTVDVSATAVTSPGFELT